MALPREATQVSYIKTLAKCLGNFTPIDIQEVSQSGPKPELWLRRVGRTACAGLLMLVTVIPSPAFAYIEIERADGSVLLLDERFVLFLLIAAVVLITAVGLAATLSSGPRTYTTVALPPEISTPEPVQYYEEHAARARALKSKLDAETELAESYINAMRTKGELDELGEILGHDKVMRLTTRGDRT